jgi:hypothetical protein
MTITELVTKAKNKADAINANPECPLCGPTDWDFLDGCAGLHLVFSHEGLDPERPDLLVGLPHGTMGAVAYACIACGYVRFHHFVNSLASAYLEP